MQRPHSPINVQLRRHLLAALSGLVVVSLLLLGAPHPAVAFGDRGAFDPRILLTGTQKEGAHADGAARWSWELIRRTSAPARLQPTVIHADDPAIVNDTFLYWSGAEAVAKLTPREVLNLQRFFSLGGMIFVDDAAPDAKGGPSRFAETARAELSRVLPEAAPFPLKTDHVVYRSFYLLDRAVGRVEGAKTLDAIVNGTTVLALFSSHDLGGALAHDGENFRYPVSPGGEQQRELAVRLAVNIAMYALCSNYKDDQVHAPFLMRRRGMLPPK